MNPIRWLLQGISVLGIGLFIVLVMIPIELLSRMWGWIWKEDSQELPTYEEDSVKEALKRLRMRN